MRVTRIASFACALMVAGLSACASGGSSGGSTDTMAGAQQANRAPMTVVIRNGAPGATTVTAYMMPEVGVDTPLGTVEAGREESFPFSGSPGRYRIRLVGASGETVSDIFDLFNNSEARWDVALGPRVRVGGRRGGG